MDRLTKNHLWNFLVLALIVILWCISVEFGSRAGWDISKPSLFIISTYLQKKEACINSFFDLMRQKPVRDVTD